ncbi:MAG: Ku protein, partial [Candidatus Acidiferrales bacterium]
RKEIAATPEPKRAPVIDMMSALKRSLEIRRPAAAGSKQARSKSAAKATPIRRVQHRKAS